MARAISLDQNLLEYLTNLVSRAYIVVYASKRRPTEAVADFLLRRLPRTVRRFAPFLAASVLLLSLGALCGYLLTRTDQERYYSLVSPVYAQGRDPSASTEELRSVLYDGGREESGTLHAFATFLFTHNAKVGILCFALGFLAGVPVVLFLFYNGLILGAMAALYGDRGLGVEFWGWILPHGVTELLAVCLCGAAGLVFGMAVVFPGERTRLGNLARLGREAALLVIGAILMLFLAAGIEGFFRQLVQDPAVRWAVAGATTVLWSFYFHRVGREAGA